MDNFALVKAPLPKQTLATKSKNNNKEKHRLACHCIKPQHQNLKTLKNELPACFNENDLKYFMDYMYVGIY